MIVSRRRFLSGASALLVAPAIVRAANLMPVKAFAEMPPLILLDQTGNGYDFFDATYERMWFDHPLTSAERDAVRENMAAYYGIPLGAVSHAARAPAR